MTTTSSRKPPAGAGIAILATALVLAAAGCSGGDDGQSSAGRGTPSPTGSSASPSGAPGATGPGTASPGATPPGGSPSAPSPPAGGTPGGSATPAPAPTDPDRGGDPVRGYRTLTGVVESTGRCPVLRVGTVRWALMDAPAAQLVTGRQVEVRGTVAPAPRGCPAARAIRVSQVRPG